MVVLLIAFPAGLYGRRRAMSARSAPRVAAPAIARARLPHDRWRAVEIAFWLVPRRRVSSSFPSYRVLGSQILITGLFAVSLDLILGYAGIVSLGHAAFFGIGAYAAGLLAVHGWGEPLTGLVVAGVGRRDRRASRRASSSCAAAISRG